MQNIHKQAVSGGRDPQQAHPPKGSTDPGQKPWRQQAVTAGRAAGADGECSPEPGKPPTDGETRRSGSFQAVTRPAAAPSPAQTPGLLVSSGAPHLPTPPVQAPRGRAPSSPGCASSSVPVDSGAGRRRRRTKHCRCCVAVGQAPQCLLGNVVSGP